MMTTMRRRGPRRRGMRAALAGGGIALAALLAATTVSAQARTRGTERDCRCVDRNGEEIPDCRCLRTPGLANLYVFRDTRARLGITVSSDQGARADAQGARVGSVMDGGPAEGAGIREGDVITRLDGHSLLEPLDSATEADFDLDRSVPVQRLLAITRDIDPGQEVEVEYLRDGETRTATIEARELSGWTSIGMGGPGWNAREMADRMRILGDSMRRLRLEMPRAALGLRLWADSTESPRFHVLTHPEAGVYLFRAPDGLDLVELNPKLAEYFGVSGGVLVADVPDDTPLGLQPGDVVLAVGDREVEGPDHLRRILRSYQPDETISFRIMRHESEMNVQGHLSR